MSVYRSFFSEREPAICEPPLTCPSFVIAWVYNVGSHDVLLVSKDNRARFCGGKGGAEAMALVEKGQLFFHRLDKQQGLLTSYQVSSSDRNSRHPLWHTTVRVDVKRAQRRLWLSPSSHPRTPCDGPAGVAPQR